MLQLQPLLPLVDEFAARLFGELDYVQEGKNAERFQVAPMPVSAHAAGLRCWCSLHDACYSAAKMLGMWQRVTLAAALQETSMLQLSLRARQWSAALRRCLAVQDLYGKVPRVRVPKIYWATTARRVLTMEWIDGALPCCQRHAPAAFWAVSSKCSQGRSSQGSPNCASRYLNLQRLHGQALQSSRDQARNRAAAAAVSYSC